MSKKKEDLKKKQRDEKQIVAEKLLQAKIEAHILRAYAVSFKSSLNLIKQASERGETMGEKESLEYLDAIIMAGSRTIASEVMKAMGKELVEFEVLKADEKQEEVIVKNKKALEW